MIVRLNQAFSEWKTGLGIFSELGQLPDYTPPWSEQVSGLSLDFQYFGNNSGNKPTSPLVDSLMQSNNVLALSNSDRIALATVIKGMYSKKWEKLWDTFLLEYDPISNYDMTEEETASGTNTGTVNNSVSTDYGRVVDSTNTETNTGTASDSRSTTYGKTVGVTGTETNTGTVGNVSDTTANSTTTGTETETPNLNTETIETGTAGNKNSLYGFNSTSAVPSDEQSGTTDTTTTQTQTGTREVKTSQTVESTGKQTDTRTDNLTKEITNSEKSTGTDTETNTRTNDLTNSMIGKETNSGTDTETGTRTDNLAHEETRRLTRKGNIGVTTSQQMIQSERELWLWDFFSLVFADVDRVLTIPVY